MTNKGINQSGGSISANNLVVGDNGAITSEGAQQSSVNNNAAQELDAVLATILERLEQSGLSQEEKTEHMDGVKTLQEEVAKPKPNKISIKAIGKSVLEGLKYIKDIAPFAQSALEMIGSMVK